MQTASILLPQVNEQLYQWLHVGMDNFKRLLAGAHAMVNSGCYCQLVYNHTNVSLGQSLQDHTDGKECEQ